MYVLLELRQSEPLVSDVVDSPPRLHCKLQHPSERQPERYGKTCAKIAFAVPTRNAIYGQQQNVDACVLRALQHCPVEASILVEIELINLRRIVCLTHIETHRAERRHAEHRAIFRSCGRDGASHRGSTRFVARSSSAACCSRWQRHVRWSSRSLR